MVSNVFNVTIFSEKKKLVSFLVTTLAVWPFFFFITKGGLSISSTHLKWQMPRPQILSRPPITSTPESPHHGISAALLFGGLLHLPHPPSCPETTQEASPTPDVISVTKKTVRIARRAKKLSLICADGLFFISAIVLTLIFPFSLLYLPQKHLHTPPPTPADRRSSFFSCNRPSGDCGRCVFVFSSFAQLFSPRTLSFLASYCINPSKTYSNQPNRHHSSVSYLFREEVNPEAP